MEKREIEIYTENIALGKFLKWAGIADTGTDAKLLIQEGLVAVNGVQETRRGRVLKPGDTVELEDLVLVVVQGEQEV